MADVAVRMKGIAKRYGAVRALIDVDAEFLTGEVHAVLGENGAGKSTLMAVLAGFVTPDAGHVILRDQPLPLGHPAAIRSRGISIVHQHFMLVPQFTVAENLALAQINSLAGPSRVNERAEKALKLAEDFGWNLEPSARVRDLPVGVQQRIEILKALADDADVLIFDEPTAVLGEDEVADLFRVLGRLRDEGKTIILIAHKLAEVMAIADRVTVLRHGRLVATSHLKESETTAEQLAEWMVGNDGAPSPRKHGAPRGTREQDRSKTVIRADGISVKGDRRELAIDQISFEIASGEILGFGGVDGNGQVELAEALVGIRPYQGRIQAPEAVYVPQDRQQDGLALGMTIKDNLWIGGQCRPDFNAGPFLRHRSLAGWSKNLIEQFKIKIGSENDPVSSLSGGNQQKVVVARSLDVTPRFLVVVNPTRGLDLKATAFVHEQILRAAEEGASIALFSTDRDELSALVDRTVYLSAGKLYESLEESLVSA